jgi:hypothetical protein
MLRQLAIESGIVLTLTTLLLALAATAGLPGRSDTPARAAEVPPSVSGGASHGDGYDPESIGVYPRFMDGMSRHIEDVR